MGNTLNRVAWFEIATDDPEAAQRFYGEMFGWSFAADERAAKGGVDYRLISYPGAEHPSGGVFGSAGRFPGHATFNVTVADVEEACRRVESLGGKVARKVVGNQNGPDFAYVLDPAGNLFGVFTT